jgi:hypothetical protein
MAWIKRNLFFVIGAVVALALIGFAGFYNFSGWKHNADEAEKLKASYEELKRLNNLNPHPGLGKVDNIKLAREQQKEIRDFLAKANRRFERIPPVPDSSGKITSEEYASALRSTIDLLIRDAANNGVTVPNAGMAAEKKFTYSFSVQSQRVQFTPPLEPLAAQLGEVKVIADILNKAKINSLDQLRRERVSADDQSGPQTDYLDSHSQTNDLAVLSPYEITFRCFSPELALVLAGFANSPHGIVVKSINVEPAPLVVGSDQPPPPVPVAIVPTPYPTPALPNYKSEADQFRARYGIGNKDSFRPPPPPQPVFIQQPVAAPLKTGPKAVLDEKQLKVVMLIQIVKPLVKK